MAHICGRERLEHPPRKPAQNLRNQEQPNVGGEEGEEDCAAEEYQCDDECPTVSYHFGHEAYGGSNFSTGGARGVLRDDD